MRTKFSIALPPDLLAWADRRAAQLNLSRARLIENCILAARVKSEAVVTNYDPAPAPAKKTT